MNTPQTFIFIGRSGSGKGTQAEMLKAYLEKEGSAPVTYVQTGQRFRDFTKGDSHTAQLAREVIETGALMPEFLGVWNWSSIFVESIKGDEHLILDGMPRRLREAHIFDSAMNFYERNMPMVIYLDISHDMAKERLLARGRADDNHDDIDRRLAWFETDVVEVLEWYERDRNYNFVRIDGEQSIEKINQDIMSAYTNLYGHNN
jgi:adenylate kinase family enzyme